MGKALLLVEGAAKDVVDVEDKGTSITHGAAREGYVDALKALVGAGADLQMARHDGATALGLVVGSKHTEVMRYILERRGVKLVNDDDALGRIVVEDGLGSMCWQQHSRRPPSWMTGSATAHPQAVSRAR